MLVRIASGLVLLISFFLEGCGGGGSASTSTQPSAGKLFISGITSSLDGQIGTYSSATFASGMLSPSRSISGTNTKLIGTGVRGVAMDVANDRLFTVNATTNSILVFDGASLANGNVAPTREITGGNTLLDAPVYIYLDDANNRLYVSNYGSSRTVLVFDNVSTISGNVAPTRVISGFALQSYSQLSGIQLDSGRNILYVADANFAAVYILDNANTINGAISASRVITGGATNLALSRALALDAGGNRLYVSSIAGTGSILVFDNANTATGNIAPNRSITTADPLFDVTGLFLDATNNRLYALNSSYRKLNYFDSASSASGTLAPTVTVNLTGMLAPFGLFVDTR